MRSIDIHAHSVPRCVVDLNEGADWHGFTVERRGPGRLNMVRGSRRGWVHPMLLWTAEERLAHMDSLGVDVHVLSSNPGLYHYDLEAEVCIGTSRDCNDDIAQMTQTWPDRFAGLAKLPMQDVKASVAELERAVTQLGLKGAMINDHVNNKTFDDPEYLPFWEAAEQLGALICFHQENETMVSARTTEYHLYNSVGNLADRAVTFATLVFGGVMDRFPNLRILLMHGGGYTCFGLGRMDRGWQVNRDSRVNISKPPSTYAKRFYYDCLTHSEEVLRFLIDTVGADRVAFGTDWPYSMDFDWPVSWVLSLESLTQEEKDLILWKNLEQLLGV